MSSTFEQQLPPSNSPPPNHEEEFPKLTTIETPDDTTTRNSITMYPTTPTTMRTKSSSSSSNAQLCAKHARRPTNDMVRHQSEFVQRYALQELGPGFQYFNTVVGPRLFQFATNFLQLNRIALAHLLLGCNILALQTLLLAKTALVALSTLVWSAWDSKQGRRLRKKVEFEFFVLILGCGNGFALIVFWPGWVLVGMAYFVYLMWTWAG